MLNHRRSFGLQNARRAGNARSIACLVIAVGLFSSVGGCSSDTGTSDAAPPKHSAATGWPKIRLHEATGDSTIVVDVVDLPPEGLNSLGRANLTDSQWREILSVHVDPEGRKDAADRPAILGSYRIEKTALRFTPRYPLERGLRYRAVFKPSNIPGHGSSEPALETYLSAARVKPPANTVVERLYPTTDKLPENQLKFYIHFSAPMSRGESYRHIHLFDSSGKEVSRPFLELDEELWDPNGKRFTLFCDPGRVKRGLKPREELGPVLEEGKNYTLVIDTVWRDANGEPLKSGYRKTFSVGPPDNQPPDPKTWTLQPPAGGSREPLTVKFPKPMEHALLQRALEVMDAKGRKVKGTVAISNEEKLWRFTPANAWQAGNYTLRVDKVLEDLAGNSIGRPFEVDEFHRVTEQVSSEWVELPFIIESRRR